MKSIRKKSIRKLGKKKAKTIKRNIKKSIRKRNIKKNGGAPPFDDDEDDPVKKYQQTKDAYSTFLGKKRKEDEKKGIFTKFKVENPKELCQWGKECSADTWRNEAKKTAHFEKYTHSPEEAEITELLYNLVMYKVNKNERNLDNYDADIKYFMQLCYRLYSENKNDFPDWMYDIIREYFKFHSDYVFDDYNSTHRLHFYLLASILKNVDYYATTYPNIIFWGRFLHALFEENAVTGIYPVPGKEPLSNTSLYFYIEKAIPK